MREKAVYVLGSLGALLLLRNLHTILLELPDEALQGAVYRIFFFHVPAAITAFAFFFVALLASIGYLVRKNFRYDAVAVASTEVGLVFATVNLVTGSIWGRNQWGIWWTWDARLTSMFICWLLYAGYLILRPAISDPAQRATLAAVLSIFAFADVPIVYLSIYWFRTQHPSPVLTSGGLDASMWPPFLWNILALMLIATAMVLVRLQQERMQREIDSIRRFAHSMA